MKTAIRLSIIAIALSFVIVVQSWGPPAPPSSGGTSLGFTIDAPGEAGGILRSNGESWARVTSLSGLIFGGFTASQGIESDASGNLISSGATPGAVISIGALAAPITTNPYSLAAANAYNKVLWYGATGEIDLPAAVAGMNIIIYNTGAYTITVDPNASDVIIRDGAAQAGGVSFTLSSGAGNYVTLVCDVANHWVTLGYKGTLGAGS